MLLKSSTAEPNPTLPAEVDAELLDDVALHLRHRHLEHDLIAAMHGDAVDDLAAVIDQTRSDIEGLLRLDRARNIAEQHDSLAQPLDPDIAARAAPA